ncbi:MAG TPA: DUF1080 domain-containing protein [Chthoniobacteraceae bacterium]|jgi:hypothetical protein|nr:DUF1080 domain-containing protein [Chthoniobacteraceae bacterium]
MRLLATALCFLLLALRTPKMEPGFRPIFDGSTLEGWSGNPDYWSARDGILKGESHGLLLSNTFLIWRGGTLKDFDLKLKVRLTNGNSGIQYRSRDIGRWVVGGYQAEIANEPGKAGFLYEERGRKFLALLGQSAGVSATGKLSVSGTLAAKEEYLQWGYYRPGDWNDYEIVARGPYLAHYVNGFKTIEFIDEDPSRALREGVLALQIHAGTSMTVEFKDIRLKVP